MTPEELKQLVMIKGLPDKSTSFSGNAKLRHGSQGELIRFEPNYTGQRYGGEHLNSDNVFGDSGTYLDSTGDFSNPPEGMRWGVKNAYDVDAKFDNARILTPENIVEFSKGVPKDHIGITENNWISGNSLAELAKAKGHDGLIVTGFDKEKIPYGELELLAPQPLNDGSHTQAEWENAWRKWGDRYTQLTERPYLKNNKIDTNIAQDQVLSFKPENHTISGKSDLSKQYKFTDFTPKTELSGDIKGLTEFALAYAAAEAMRPSVAGEGSDTLPEDQQIYKDKYNGYMKAYLRGEGSKPVEPKASKFNLYAN